MYVYAVRSSNMYSYDRSDRRLSCLIFIRPTRGAKPMYVGVLPFCVDPSNDNALVYIFPFSFPHKFINHKGIRYLSLFNPPKFAYPAVTAEGPKVQSAFPIPESLEPVGSGSGPSPRPLRSWDLLHSPLPYEAVHLHH